MLSHDYPEGSFWQPPTATVRNLEESRGSHSCISILELAKTPVIAIVAKSYPSVECQQTYNHVTTYTHPNYHKDPKRPRSIVKAGCVGLHAWGGYTCCAALSPRPCLNRIVKPAF